MNVPIKLTKPAAHPDYCGSAGQVIHVHIKHAEALINAGCATAEDAVHEAIQHAKELVEKPKKETTKLRTEGKETR